MKDEKRTTRGGEGDDFSPEAIVNSGGTGLADRICLYAPPKWGKSAWAAHAPDPVFLCTKGENGILVLMKAGLVPAGVRHFPRCAETWQELGRALTTMIARGPRPGTIVIDTLNGAEQLCHAHVCQTQYGGDWGEKGFSAYQVGYRTAGPKEFERLLELIDRLSELGCRVICLCHTATRTRKNPRGPDFDVFAPAMHEKTWETAARRFDVLLFGTFEEFVDKQSPRDRKGKAHGGERRVLLAQPSATHEAGGRYDLPPEIDCGESAKEAWENFSEALKVRQE